MTTLPILPSGPILHVDMDCFFVACELLNRPDLKGKPVAVGGRPEERGVISTSNYEARKFGVRSALSSKLAFQRCPHLILLPHNFSKYQEMAEHIHEIFARYTKRVASVGLDEAYLDLSHQTLGQARATAEVIKFDILKETKLIASCGIGPNPFLAKVASDWKKPNGFFVISPDQVASFVRQLPLRAIPGIGPATEARFKELGINTVVAIQNAGLNFLQNYFGKYGEVLYQLAHGIDERDVFDSTPRKTLSVEHTFIQDLVELSELKAAILDLCQEWQDRFEDFKNDCDGEDEEVDNDDPMIKNLFIKIKFSDFKTHTLAQQINSSDFSVEKNSASIFDTLIESAYQKWPDRPVRLLGVGCHFKGSAQEISSEELTEYQQLELDLVPMVFSHN